jgi:aryl-alcohol dehydrogenase-like predicted oxidoreductase
MQTKQLANTDVSISAIGLGGMLLSLSNRPPESQAIAVIHRALDLGVTLIDTADSYRRDESDKHHNERLIHKALQRYNGDTSHVIVATKGGLMRPEGSWTRNGNPDRLRDTIRISFEALGGSKPIDVWQYHAPDPNYTIEDALKPAKEAVEEGLIRFVGVSNFSVEQIERARKVVEIVSVQNQYNPWHRQPEIVPIPGASKVSSIEDSVGSVEVTLSPAEVARIDEV